MGAQFEDVQKIGNAQEHLDELDRAGPDQYAAELRKHGCEFCLEAAESDLIEGGSGARYKYYETSDYRRHNLAVCDDHAPYAQATVGLSHASPGGHVNFAVSLPPFAVELFARRWHGFLDGNGNWLVVNFGIGEGLSGSSPTESESLIGVAAPKGTLKLQLTSNPVAVLTEDYCAEKTIEFSVQHADFTSMYLAIAYYFDDPTYSFDGRNCLDITFQALQQLNAELPNGETVSDNTPAAWFASLQTLIESRGSEIKERYGLPLSPPNYYRGIDKPKPAKRRRLSVDLLLFDRYVVGGQGPPSLRPLRCMSIDLGSRNASGARYRIPGTLMLTGTPGDKITGIDLEILSEKKIAGSMPLTAAAVNQCNQPFDRDGRLTIGVTNGQPINLWDAPLKILSGLCAQGHSKVQLRVRVTTAMGDSIVKNWGPVYITICLEIAVRGILPAAKKFADLLMRDSRLRRDYVDEAERVSKLLLEVTEHAQNGETLRDKTLEDSAWWANKIRNDIMNATRDASSELSRMLAILKKEKGLSFDDALARKTKAKFGRSAKFEYLTEGQREQLFKAVIVSSGKSNSLVNAIVLKGFPHFSDGLRAISVGVAVFHIANAEDQVKAALEEAIVIGGSAAVAVALPAAYGLAFAGPPGPFIAFGLYFVGGMIGAALGEVGFTLEEEQRDCVLKWLGDDRPVPTPIPGPPPVRQRRSLNRVEKSELPQYLDNAVLAAENKGNLIDPINVVYMIKSGSRVHLLEECPSLRDSHASVTPKKIRATTNLEALSSRFERPICGTCLRMLGLGSRMLFSAESDISRLEIKTDCVALITKGTWISSEHVLEIAISDLVNVGKTEPNWFYKTAGLIIGYSNGLMLPAEQEAGEGEFVFRFLYPAERDQAFELVREAIGQKE